MNAHYTGILLWLTLTLPAFGQQANDWHILADVTIENNYDSSAGYEIAVPVFGKKVSRKEGTSLELRGYILPLQDYKGGSHFMFSAYPYNACFFCGNAGPETVVEVYAKIPIEYDEDPVTLRGILTLNSSDPEKHIYLLKSASLISKN